MGFFYVCCVRICIGIYVLLVVMLMWCGCVCLWCGIVSVSMLLCRFVLICDVLRLVFSMKDCV